MKNIDLTKFIRKDIIDAPTYHVASAQDKTKLDAMENPFNLPVELQQILAKHLAQADINRYPSPELYQHSIDIIRAYANIPQELDILLGNGSDEIISMLANILPDNSSILAPLPSFVMYKASADIAKLNFIGIDLIKDNDNLEFNLDVENIKLSIDKHNPKLIYIAYPNNPTGACFDKKNIDEIINYATYTNNSLVIIDEAYQAFTGNKTYMQDKLPPNVLVMRTLSKIGLAGLRLGYIAGNPQIIQQLNKVRPPYNINSFTQVAIHYLLGNKDNLDILSKQAKIICAQRVIMQQRLSKFGDVFNSDANFLLVKMHHNANDIYQALNEKHNIIVKNISKMHISLDNCLRISIGTEQENNKLIMALENIYEVFIL